MRRSDQRRAAVFALYQGEVTGRPPAEALDDAKPFTRELVEGVEEHRAELDAEIARLARGWELDRIAALEKSIMRVALYELHHRDDVPDRGGDRRGRVPRQALLRRRRARVRERRPGDAAAKAAIRLAFPAMSSTEQLAERLREIAARLRDPELPEEEAEGLAREAAELVSKAGPEIESALREIAAREGP